MAGLVVLCVVLACTLASVVVMGERQLRAMGRTLAQRQAGGPGRLRLSLPTPAARALARRANGLIDEAEGARRAAAAERRELQRNLASFSHDVRTPLAGAQGYLQLYALAESDAERDECVAAAVERLGVMRGLVDQLFEFAKADEGERDLVEEDVDVVALLTERLEAWRAAFTARGWELTAALPPGPLVVRADGEALGRVLDNLLGNCLRHGTAAPTIELEAVPRVTADTVAREDALPIPEGAAAGFEAMGIGVPDGVPAARTAVPGGRAGACAAFELSLANEADGLEDLDVVRLFDRFYRGDTARRAGGSGLGLAIAAGLARAMDMDLAAAIDGNQFRIALRG